MNYYNITITVYNRELAFSKVSKLIHDYAPKINLRVGYPIPDENIAVIFILVHLTNDELGSLTGKLGQIAEVKVKTAKIKTKKKEKK